MEPSELTADERCVAAFRLSPFDKGKNDKPTHSALTRTGQDREGNGQTLVVQGLEQVEFPVENLGAAGVLAGNATLAPQPDRPDEIAQAAHLGFDLNLAPRFKPEPQVVAGCHGPASPVFSVRRGGSRATYRDRRYNRAVEYEHILYDVADGIATITLNRPERLNAFDNLMLSEWRDAIERSDADREVRVIILTGAGRGFCSGMDVAHETAGEGVLQSEESVAERRHSLRNSVHHIPRALVQLEKPYIAAVNGAAVGAGMDMASMADIRFASERARFGMGYVRMGLIPGDGGAWTLPRIVGRAKALELIWSGELVDAQEALRIGYVSEVCPPEELLDRTREFAQKIARGPATAIQLAKKLVYRSANLTFDEHLDFAQMAMTLAQSTEDAKEGPLAFTEKREPNFKGH